jgi:hypothetical protein
VGDGDHDQDDEELHRGAVCRLMLEPQPRSRHRRSRPALHLELISGTERGLHWTRTLGRPCARSGEEGHERCREWPPVVRDVRDPDDDRRRAATPWTQVRLGRPRGPCSGARLPKVGVSRWSTSATATTTRTTGTRARSQTASQPNGQALTFARGRSASAMMQGWLGGSRGRTFLWLGTLDPGRYDRSRS